MSRVNVEAKPSASSLFGKSVSNSSKEGSFSECYMLFLTATSALLSIGKIIKYQNYSLQMATKKTPTGLSHHTS